MAGLVGIPIGIALLVGTLEFVGPNEPDGWTLAGTIVPIAYIAWSIWLIVLGVLLLPCEGDRWPPGNPCRSG